MDEIRKTDDPNFKLTTKPGINGDYLFLKTSDGLYRAYKQVTTRDAIVEVANKIGKETPMANTTEQNCKEILGF